VATDLSALEQQILRSVSLKVHDRLRKAAESQVGPEAFGDPEAIADAMVAALPLGHPFDEAAGPFYDTSGLGRWLGISRQAVHQRADRHAILGCPLEDGTTVYPVWQFLDTGATLPGLTEVLTVLSAGGDDPWMAALWLSAPNGQLDGATPAQWLRDGGDPAPVLAAARRTAAGWRA